MDIDIVLQNQTERLWIIAVFLLAGVFLTGLGRHRKKRYARSEYRRETGNKRKKVEQDAGKNGEYETSIALEKIRGRRCFVFNAYIPRADGRGSVEIDIIMIHERGIVVIENKNYSGEISGRADQAYWQQRLSGKRTGFYSPVYQNISHVRHVRSFLKNHMDGRQSPPVFSAVIFNDRIQKLKIRRKWRSEAVICVSKKASKKIWKKLKRQESVFSEAEMEELYRLLKSRAEVFRWVKRRHRKKVIKYKKMLD